ncbi:MAG: glutamate synthase subunit beta [Synergistaceae bacterium]|jgi:glutamate synthase (NADPH/NADH) small chain|nr:glutamate synthase subunit beta [Synergistaceae bacterium]
MGKPTGFIEYERVEAEYRPIKERILDYAELTQPIDKDMITQQSARCMDCGVSFCHAGTLVDGTSIGCPLGNLVPEINDLVYNGDIEGAYDRMSRTHPFPEFTSRVCPALCEGSCTLGEHESPVTIKNIERYVIDFMLQGGKIRPRMPRIRTSKKVAVVGSGPSGLACADMLNHLGNDVTVFERADRPGGLLIYGIPNMKLDKSLVENRIRIMTEENVKFVLNSEIGLDVPVSRMLNDFDAIVLCCGATNERRLNVPGSGLDGVRTALEYLTSSTKRLLGAETKIDTALDARGKKVVIVGGGDTGTDCAGTAIRQGAASVIQLEILPKPHETRQEDNPWPLWPKILRTDYGQYEAKELFGGDPRKYLTTVREIKGDGAVSSVVTVDVEWVTENGRMTPRPQEGTEAELPADLVLTAMGFTGPEKTLIDQMQLDVDGRGSVLADDEYKSSLLTVFAAGDMRRGPSLVVWALSEGRNAAIACDAYLNGAKK